MAPGLARRARRRRRNDAREYLCRNARRIDALSFQGIRLVTGRALGQRHDYLRGPPAAGTPGGLSGRSCRPPAHHSSGSDTFLCGSVRRRSVRSQRLDLVSGVDDSRHGESHGQQSGMDLGNQSIVSRATWSGAVDRIVGSWSRNIHLAVARRMERRGCSDGEEPISHWELEAYSWPCP